MVNLQGRRHGVGPGGRKREIGVGRLPPAYAWLRRGGRRPARGCIILALSGQQSERSVLGDEDYLQRSVEQARWRGCWKSVSDCIFMVSPQHHSLRAPGERQLVKPLLTLLAAFAFVAGSRSTENAALGLRIVAAARQQIGVTKEYDPSYRTLLICIE